MTKLDKILAKHGNDFADPDKKRLSEDVRADGLRLTRQVRTIMAEALMVMSLRTQVRADAVALAQAQLATLAAIPATSSNTVLVNAIHKLLNSS